MTAEELLQEFPSSIIIALTNPYTGRVRFVMEDERGEREIDPPSNYRSAFNLFDYKPVVRRQMGRADVATSGE